MLVKKKQESSLAVIAMYTITSNNHYILLQAVNIAEPAAL